MGENMSLGSEPGRARIEALLEEYDGWRGLQDRVNDEFDLVAKAVALYRFAIANQDRDGRELLNEALDVFEKAKAES